MLRRSPLSLAAALLCLLVTGCASPSTSTAPNLDDASVALAGYDPTTYFEGAPRRGRPDCTATHAKAVYRFLDDEHRARFEADPERFVPQFGGWCAWAVAEGYTYRVDPESFLIQDGRLLLFYDGSFGDTRALWAAGDPDASLATADGNWSAWAQADALENGDAEE